ncbi:MAG TPA: acetylornithine transaminase [Chthonomonas sp.]|jgi:acetylornithine/N-succinyldiaminopimelate aminotransferase|uniref:acetylornithine transaminase n=1 Tax=Chthonomonas sp. TaxID=2282153 RepID=UPI002B4AB05C|nr:acetylornithine transaminase [Chthonomonas sp.]HLH80352.1 acetylornithine transaminase [Chthonomonas sp.]
MPTVEPQAGVNAQEIFELDSRYVMGTYARRPVVFVRGEGATLYDSEGRAYLDFLAGIAVVSVGHCHPRIAGAIAQQAHTLMHVSNLFHNAHQAKLAKRLCDLTGMERVFFCNSGAEANEAALKIARKWGKQQRGELCYEIITFHGSFHGRTLGTVTATAQPKYQKPFEPLVPGFHYAPLNDLEAFRSLLSERTCAVMIEPIQGESGIHPCDPDFLKAVRALCDEARVLLIFDEVQCGLGRTGHFLGSQALGVQGDIVTLAKGIADGFPMGACLARGEAALTLVPGDHGSTFAGQPLACAAALATLDVLEEENLMARAAETGAYFLSRLRALQRAHSNRIKEVRGLGLMVGVELMQPKARAVLDSLFQQGIVANAIGDSTLRFVPPLVVTKADCDRVVQALEYALQPAS